MRKCIQTKQNTSISHQYSLNPEMLIVLILLKPDYYNLKKRTENSFSLIRKSALKRESRNSSKFHIFTFHSHNQNYRHSGPTSASDSNYLVFTRPYASASDSLHLILTTSHSPVLLIMIPREGRRGEGGSTGVNFCWVCAAGLSKLPILSTQ